METLLCSGKSIFAAQRISYDNKIAAGGLILSRSLLQWDFLTGDFISWHPGILAAMAEYTTICAWNKCYTFANILQAPILILNLTIFESQWNVDSNDILSIWKYFHVRVEYIYVLKIRHSAHSNQWGTNAKKYPKQPLPFGACEPPCKT